jgi:hypothetical protein
MHGFYCKNCGRQETNHLDSVEYTVEPRVVLPGFEFSLENCPRFTLYDEDVEPNARLGPVDPSDQDRRAATHDLSNGD